MARAAPWLAWAAVALPAVALWWMAFYVAHLYRFGLGAALAALMLPLALLVSVAWARPLPWRLVLAGQAAYLLFRIGGADRVALEAMGAVLMVAAITAGLLEVAHRLRACAVPDGSPGGG